MRTANAVCLLVLISAFTSIEAKDANKPKNAPVKLVKKTARVPEKLEKVPDFSRGFAMFHKLGVPDVSKAEYIKIDDGNYYQQSNMTGNAWLVKDKGDKGIIVFKDNVKVEFPNPVTIRKQRFEDLKKLKKKFKGKKKKLAEAQKALDIKYGKIKSVTYKKADLKKDIVAFNKLLNKVASQNERDMFNMNVAHGGIGQLFIFAINLYDKGYKREANKAASILFKKFGRKKIIVSAVNQLADDFYAGIYRDFSKTKDWKSYSSKLDALIKKMPAAWTKKPALKILVLRIKERIAGKVPEINPKGLSPKDLEIAKKLVNVKTFSRTNLWLLPPSKAEKMYRDASVEKEKVFDEIFAKGVKSIPLLAALAKDNYLTDITMQYSSYNHRYSLPGNDIVDPEKAYKRLQMRPMSRGDIARALLSSILLEQERSFGEDDEDDTASRALELYKKLKDKTTEEIAEYYLKHGTPYGQKRAAVNYLVETKNPKYIAVVEKYYIDNASLNSRYEVTQYLENRGPEAKEFVKKYLKALKESLKGRLKEEGRYSESEKQLLEAKKRLDKQYEEIVKAFKKYLSSETAEQLLMKIAAKKKWESSNYDALRFKCKNISLNKLVPMFLKAAIAAKSIEVKSSLLGIVRAFQRPRYNAENVKVFTDFKGTKALWLELINDKSIFPNTVDYTIGQYTLYIIEQISRKKMDYKREGKLRLLSAERYNAILRKRALGRLDGKSESELAPLPDASKVSKSEYKKVVAELEKAHAKQLAGKIKKLSDNVFLKLTENISAHQALNKKMLVIANKITKIDNKIKDKNIVRKLARIKGSLNEELIKQMVEILKTINLKKKYIYCQLRVNNGLNGVTIAFSLKDKKKNKYRKGNYLFAVINAGRIYANCSWVIKKAKEAKKAKVSDDEDEDLFAEAEEDVEDDENNEMLSKQKAFWEGVKKFVNRTNAMQGGSIYFQYN